jgi:hypothetical protein
LQKQRFILTYLLVVFCTMAEHHQTTIVPESASTSTIASSEVISLRSEVADLKAKLDQLLENMAKQTPSHISETDVDKDSIMEGVEPTIETRRGKKHAHTNVDANIEEITRPHKSSHLQAPIVHTKEPSAPLPEAYDGNPKHLKIFLEMLSLCFRASPSKYARDEVKIIIVGRLCTNPKVYLWWDTWKEHWMKDERGYCTWKDFESVMRS